MILIVGAGVAGLAAGRELARRGHQLVILEARDRIGGRILTARDPLSPLPAELGAEMVHGLHADLWQLLRESAATVVEMGGTHLTRDAKGLHPAGNFEEIGKVFAEMAMAKEQSFQSFLAGVKVSSEVKQAATGFVEGFNAAHKEDVSVAWLNQENAASEETDGERIFRVVDGYDTVPAFLSRGLDIRFSTVVKRIRWRKSEVTVETDRGEFKGSKAIVTVPFPLLRTRTVEIDPEPPVLVQAREAIATGHAIRITFRFRQPPWGKYQQLSFLHGDEAFPVWWTPSPVMSPQITAWAAGPKSDALRGLTRDELVRTALSSLRAILGEDFEAPETAHFHDWAADPFSQGAYSYVRVGGMDAQKALGTSVENTIFFAGEAVDASGHMGTVHGAIASGIKAAQLTQNA